MTKQIPRFLRSVFTNSYPGGLTVNPNEHQDYKIVGGWVDKPYVREWRKQVFETVLRGIYNRHREDELFRWELEAKAIVDEFNYPELAQVATQLKNETYGRYRALRHNQQNNTPNPNPSAAEIKQPKKPLWKIALRYSLRH